MHKRITSAAYLQDRDLISNISSEVDRVVSSVAEEKTDPPGVCGFSQFHIQPLFDRSFNHRVHYRLPTLLMTTSPIFGAYGRPTMRGINIQWFFQTCF